MNLHSALQSQEISVVDWSRHLDSFRFFQRTNYSDELFAAGNHELLNHPLVGVTGSRSISMESEARMADLSLALSEQQATILSGGARGTDCVAHTTALNHEGSSIVVLPIELGGFVPGHRLPDVKEENLGQRVLMLSQFTSKDQNFRSMPIIRNRVIAGLSWAGIVGETFSGSGTMSTVRSLLEFETPTFFLAPDENASTEWKNVSLQLSQQKCEPLSWSQDSELIFLAEKIIDSAKRSRAKTLRTLESQLDLFREMT